MANNRLYLYCTECNRHQYLAKSFGDHWSTSPNDHETTGDLFVNFADDHFFCGKDDYSDTIELRWEHGRRKQQLPDSSLQKGSEWEGNQIIKDIEFKAVDDGPV